MIYLIITIIVLSIALVMVVSRYHNSVVENRTLQSQIRFDNTIPRKQYNIMATFLRQKKSRLSFATKVELLNMWINLMLIFPKDYRDICTIKPDVINMDEDTLTQAEHKKAIIEALEKLADSDTVLNTELSAVAYHIYFIIFN